VRKAFAEKPFLGICVGMQVLFEFGDENGGSDGLGLVAGKVVRFVDKPGLKVPHMGWNQVFHQSHPLFDGIPNGARFYFVHSYKVAPTSPEDVQIATCDYGGQFPVAIAGKNWLATQFHPEKSHQWGLKLLSNFIQWQPFAEA
jgi:glutamine amidotransferase